MSEQPRTRAAKISRYSAKAKRGLGQFCVWDNQTGRRVSDWMDMLDAMLEASKRNQQLRSKTEEDSSPQ